MAQQQMVFEGTVAAPVETVFEHFADHEWLIGLFGMRCRRVQEGQLEPNGLGSVRQIGFGPLAFDETTIVYEPHAKIDYTITRGSPLKNHLGQIRLESEGINRTRYRYTIVLDGKLPGIAPAVKRVMTLGWKLNANKKLAALS